MTTPCTDCKSCPSYLGEASDVVRVFGKTPGSPMCGSYGHVLGNPKVKGAGADSITTAFAAGCPTPGADLPTVAPRVPTAQVTLGDPRIMLNPMPSDDERKHVTSCAGCANYIEPMAVKDEFGWTFGMCAASGRLIFPRRLTKEAQGCDWRTPGTPRNSTLGIVAHPVFEAAADFDPDPVKRLLAKGVKSTIVEPTTYPSDADVEDEHRELGIRAFRKISDPKGYGPDVFLPCFDVAHFSPEEALKIPRTGDDEHPELFFDYAGLVYKLAVWWTRRDQTPALWGVAGVGKTEVFRHMAWLMCLPFERISITNYSEVDDLIGKFLAPADEHGVVSTQFTPGRITKAWEKPCVILIDEANAAPDAVWQTIRPLTDNSKQLVLDVWDGRRVSRNGCCYPGMAMNPAWDLRNAGVRDLADADGNRLVHQYLDYPPADVERSIIRTAVKEIYDFDLPANTLDKMMEIALQLRALGKDGTIPVSWGIRQQIKVGGELEFFDMIDSYSHAVADMLEPAKRDIVLDVVRQYHKSAVSAGSAAPF